MSAPNHLAVSPLPEQYAYLDRLVPLFYQAWTSFWPELKMTLCLLGDGHLEFDDCANLTVTRLPISDPDRLSELQLLLTVSSPCFANCASDRDTVLLADLNKLPLKADYFTDPLRVSNGNGHLITYRDNFVNRRQTLTSYHIATHRTWCNIFGLNLSIDCSGEQMWLTLTSRLADSLTRLDAVKLRNLFYCQIDAWQKRDASHKWTRLNDRATGFKRLEQDYILESVETLRLRGRHTDLAVNHRQYNTLNNLHPITDVLKPLIKITPKFNLNSLYDCCYIINLKERTDRRDHMSGEIDRFEVSNVEFFDAVRPTSQQVAEWHPNFCGYMERRLGRKFPQYQIGALGCLLSHRNIMTRAIEAGHERILILEDDTKFHRSLTELGESLHEINNEYDMLYLSVNNMRPPTQVSPHFYRLRRGLTTSAYLITRPTMIEVVRKLAGYGKEIDTFYTEQIQPKYRCYVYKPYITGQIPSQSDIMQRKVSYHLR